ncbi:tRNA 2-thiouridine synthesizing protein B [Pseudoalteromonas rubra]|uniref:tRNA 2-thiouridine synthesizing protein B n=1 Tax=Pseudoalteromonas rubra TaxID=43658 RepID=A0A8T0C4W3_9GAMM|nr:hypothetical protein [Pseudoalteromonas rubra]KAF7785673.1 tRNA 2-thiouridine synthesizing protein B [Pseudoalteromonas rubra]
MSLPTLHIFSKPMSYYKAAFDASLLGEQDVLLLTRDACYDQSAWRALSANRICMLSICAQARGVNAQDNIELLDDQQWIMLVEQCQKTITW